MIRSLVDIVLMIAIAIVWVFSLAWVAIEIAKALGWIG
ncbi:hypothetical protein EV561_1716 [Rhizobium sp. BK376]|nr:hypothetical protein EV561_1716 [Rhizobium sp. BK376]